ncbi:hypothetical protein TNCV_2323841 [Trichonephila clavipes]|nr:hypothetical protein TNCV_2323841 [Trichonephila clavipes]
MFINLHHKLCVCEYGLLQGNRLNENGQRVTQTFSMEQNVLDTVKRNPNISIRAIAVAKRGLRSSVHRVLQREGKTLHSLIPSSKNVVTSCDAI